MGQDAGNASEELQLDVLEAKDQAEIQPSCPPNPPLPTSLSSPRPLAPPKNLCRWVAALIAGVIGEGQDRGATHLHEARSGGYRGHQGSGFGDSAKMTG